VAVLLVVFLAGAVSAGTYYVDIEGRGGPCDDDYSKEENDIAHPWCRPFSSRLLSGDTYIIRGGTYHNRLYLMERSDIVLKGYRDEMPVFDGEFTLPGGEWASSGSLFQIGNQSQHNSNLTIEGIEIRRSAGNAITIYGYDGAVVRNVVVRDIMESAIIFKTCDNVLLEDSEIYNVQEAHIGGQPRPWGTAIGAIHVENAIIRRTIMHNSSGEGISALGCRYCVVEDCTISNCRSAHLYANWGRDIIFRNNLVYATREPKFYRGHGAASSCIAVSNEPPEHTPSADKYLALGYGVDIEIYNNMMAGALSGISIGGSYTTGRNISIHNNIIGDSISDDDNHTGIRIYDDVEDVRIKNNIIVQEEGSIASIGSRAGVEMSHNLWSKRPGDLDAIGEGDIYEDPKLARSSGWTNLVPGEVSFVDFVPQEGSLAIGNGEVLDDEYAFDYFGNYRGDEWDIGAFEYGGSGQPRPEEVCGNGVDDDLDGLVDCDDSDCSGDSECYVEPPSGDCGGMSLLMRFDESGAVDSSGSGNDGVVHGATYTSGRFGGGYDFDGVDDYVGLRSIDLRDKSFSISAWVRPDASDSDQVYFSAHSAESMRNSLHLRIYPSGAIRFGLYGDDLSSEAGVVDFGAWQNVVVVHDAVGDFSWIYVDGEEVVSGAQEDFVGVDPVVSIGNWRGDEGGSQFFDGVIDEVGVWDRVLSDSEVEGLSAGVVSCECVVVGLGDVSAKILEWKSGVVGIDAVLDVVEGWKVGC